MRTASELTRQRRCSHTRYIDESSPLCEYSYVYQTETASQKAGDTRGTSRREGYGSADAASPEIHQFRGNQVPLSLIFTNLIRSGVLPNNQSSLG